MTEETKQFYLSKGFAARVGFGRSPALLVVDLIKGFTDLSSPLASNLDKEVAATRRLLDASRQARIPVHFTTIAFAEGFADAGTFIKKVPSLNVLKIGSPLVEVDDRLAPLPNESVWSKKGASSFFGTALAATLTASGVDTVLITGCTTSGCVRASAVDSCQSGFNTIVVHEAVGDRAQGPHEANLFDMDAKYADVVSLDDALAYLERPQRKTA